jgi:ferredoxin
VDENSARDLAGFEVTIDRGSCMAAGECVHHAPRTFAIGPDRRVEVATDWQHAGDTAEDVIDAAMSCPNFVIGVRRDGVRLN